MASDVSVTPKIEKGDFSKIAAAIVAEFEARQKRRGDLEKIWASIDRQLRMEPELSHKMNQNKQIDRESAWMPEVELPLQAQTLEMLTSDSRRMTFPHNRNWFKCRAALSNDYLQRYQNAGSPFPGEKDPLARSIMNQDNADRLAEGMISHWHGQYDFRGHIDATYAQSFSYGVGVGRMRKVRRSVLGTDASIGPKDQMIPVYVPRDIKRTYLDDNPYAIMNEGYTLGPNIIDWRTMKLADLQAAAAAETGDENSEMGGYIQDEISRLIPDKHGLVQLYELEGDVVFDRGTETVIVKNVVVTAATGKKGNEALVRYQKGEGFSTYIVKKYHVENPATEYATSPLVKGMPIAMAAAQALNRVIESGLLKTGPPLGYDKDDPAMAGRGGPVVQPKAKWPSTEEIKVYTEIGGEPATLFGIFQGLVNLYYDVTGVNQPRLGAQTKSHTTAFAKDVEMTQGAVRTVDFVNSVLEGPLTRLLQLEYRMGLKAMGGRNHMIYIEQWNEFVNINRKHLPDIVKFQAIGAGAPAEDAAQQSRRLESAQFAMQLDTLAAQLGRQPKLDHGALIDQILSGGGWTDTTAITTEEEQPGAVSPEQLPGVASGEVASLA